MSSTSTEDADVISAVLPAKDLLLLVQANLPLHLLASFITMGFDVNGALRALFATDWIDLEQATNWFLAASDASPDINAPAVFAIPSCRRFV